MTDYIIVGAGIFGATCARLLADAGKNVRILERRNEVGGNCHDYKRDGILVGKYGGHIFHTNSEKVWQYVNKFAEFTQYEHRVKAKYQGRTFSFPINRLTFEQFGIPVNAKAKQLLFDIFYVGYSEKQWGRPITKLPQSIYSRVPMRDTYDDRYFTDTYQGMPIGGYSQMIGKMINGIPITFGAEVTHKNLDDWRSRATKIIYTGPIDELFGYEFGRLEYRSLEFRTLKIEGDFQGCATVNYADAKIPYTRVLEWKHYYRQELPYTIYTVEYPRPHTSVSEPYYPIRDGVNMALYKKYAERVRNTPWLLVGGRLGSYQYLNMDQAIGQAMTLVKKELQDGG